MTPSEEPASQEAQLPYRGEPGRSVSSFAAYSAYDTTGRRWQPLATPTGKRPGVAWGLVALVLLVSCCGGVLAYAAQQAGEPSRAALAYCDALKARDYSTAYSLLSTSLQAPTTMRQYTAQQKLRDMIDGPVTHCQAVNSGADGSGGILRGLGNVFGGTRTATVRATITRARLGTRGGDVTILMQAGGWKVGAVAAALLGTPLAPLDVASHFCNALIAGDYNAAYSDLSTHQVSLEQSEATFASQVALPAGTRYVGCALEYSGYKVAGSSASLPLTLSIAVTTPNGVPVVPVKGSVTIVLEHGTWKLDGLDLPASSS